MCRTEGNSDRRNRRRGLTAAAVSPGGFACAAAPAALFFTLPHDHGCRYKPNTDPTALVYAESQPTPHLNINAAYVHFQTVGFLKAAGRENTDHIGVWVLTGSERIRPVDLELTRSP